MKSDMATVLVIDDDPALEIVLGASTGKVYAYDTDGSMVSGWPIQTDAEIFSSPSIDDLDGDGRLDLIVSDEGRGFDVGDTMERATSGKALGLLGMQERVSMLGGQVAIESTPGKGTTIRASMPVEVES